MNFVIPFPAIDPTLLEIGPFAIRWYALAYIVGLVVGWWYGRAICRRAAPPILTDQQTEDLLVWSTFGVILGGRLGYVLFYDPGHFFHNPVDILKVWKGGMSFHGGMMGVTLAMIAFCWRRKAPLLRVSDMVSCVVPLGLFLGRIANFINGELYGRPAPDVPWAMVFPNGGPFPRHPSQLYEATLEGLGLLVLLWLLWRLTNLGQRPGALTGIFLMGYGCARIFCEFFREPDTQIGFLQMGTTMGQILSIPMVIAGAIFLGLALRRPALARQA